MTTGRRLRDDPAVADGAVVRWAPGRRAVGRLARAHGHHVVLVAWGVVCSLVYGRHGGQSWHFLAAGAHSLTCSAQAASPCGLHVYAQHPGIQIGPLSLLVAWVAVLPGGSEDGFEVARIAMMVAGLVLLLLVERSTHAEDDEARSRLRLRVLLAGLAFAPAWADLATGFGHLDDVLALLFTTIAVDAVTRGRPRACGIALALAVLAKPWALAFLPLVFALPRPRWRQAFGWALLPVAAVTGVFLAADPANLGAGRFRIPNSPASALRVLGVSDATPPWDRPAQLALGWLLGSVAVALRRWRTDSWRAVVMIAAACRIMLDPQVYSYYTAGVLVGTLIWDVQVRRGRVVPLWTWATFAALFASRYLALSPTALGALRLTICVTLLVACLTTVGVLERLGVPPPSRPRQPAADQDEDQMTPDMTTEPTTVGAAGGAGGRGSDGPGWR